jgi:hypothetical protein
MLSRRDLVGKLAAGTAAAVCATGIARASFASTRRETGTTTGAAPASTANNAAPLPQVVDAGPPATLNAPAPWELVHPLAMGTAVTRDWRVAGLTGAVNGSCVLTLENTRGRTHRIHICRNDGRPQGLVYTKRFDLVVMNGGEGDLPTEEGFAKAVAEVAHVLAANEYKQQHEAVVASLLPHAARVEQFAATARLR